MCAEAAEAAAEKRAAEAAEAAAGGGAAAWGGGLAEACAVSLADAAPPLRPAADEPVCAALQHVYRSQAFRTWWNAANGPAAAPDRSAQWLQYRAKGLELIEYVRENHATLAQLERSVEERMHAVLAGEDAAAPAEAPAEPPAEAPVEAAAEAPEEAPEEAAEEAAAEAPPEPPPEPPPEAPVLELAEEASEAPSEAPPPADE